MRKHPIILITVILAMAVGWGGIFWIFNGTRHEARDTMTHAKLTIKRDGVEMRRSALRSDIGRFERDMDWANPRESYLVFLYGEFWPTIYPACRTWTDQDWDAYKLRWEKRKEAARGKEWWIDDPSQGHFTKTNYEPQEPAYMQLAQCREDDAWIDKEWAKTKDPIPAETTPAP